MLCCSELVLECLAKTASKVLVDSMELNKCFKNGKLKESGILKIYKYGDYFYKFKSGKYVKNYKDGSKSIFLLDDWGTDLEAYHFDSGGNLIKEWVTTKVETTAVDLEEFLNSNKHITYDTAFKDYRYDYKLCKYYLKKKGQYSNGKKVGAWKFFDSSGNLKKEKKY